MKKLIYLILVTLFLVACSDQQTTEETPKETIDPGTQEGIIVRGKFIGEAALPDTIMILKSRGRNMLPLNGGKVAEDGSFELQLKDDELWVYFIQFGSKRIPFISDEQEIELTINLDAENSDVTYHNSKEGQILKGMSPFIPDSLEKGKAYALENAPSFVSLVFAQSYLNPKEEFDYLKELVAKYSITEQPYSVKFVEEVAKFDPNFLKIGSKVPNIALPNPMGEVKTLESLRGKVVLLDFWASWCGPCISEMPNVKKAYAKYHAQGFDVYGVSLDKDKDKWLGAIQRLDMPWTHVSDLKMWESPVVSQFGIKGIPFTILVGKDGTILAKNLRGPYLNKELAELF